MKIFSTILLLTGLLLAIEETTPSCVCVEPVASTPEQIRERLTEEAEWAEVVFSGEVLFVDFLKVKFKVDRVWKGEDREEITMSTGAESTKEGRIRASSCDYGFTVGEKYIVYAKRIKGELQTSQCTGTRPQKNAGPRMEFLDELQRIEKQKGANRRGPT